MKPTDIETTLATLFSNDYDVSKYYIKTWIYKKNVCVIDFCIDDYIFAFDVICNDNKLEVFIINRRINKRLEFIPLQKLSLLTVFEKIKDYVITQRNNILNEYSYFIGVIIPVYNREFIISDCVKSLNSQTLSYDKFEVIFVDDYSSDSSVEVIENNISKGINYRILNRPINSGSASAPRNDGIYYSKSRYVLFLDSDDYIFDYTLKNLYDCALKNNPDVVYLRIDGDKGRVFGQKPFKKGNVDLASIADDHLVRSLMPSKMIKRTMLIEHGILFPVDIKVGEDRVFILQCLSKAKRISILADKPYYYLTNHDGDRLTFSVQTLEKDLEIVSRTFRAIYNADMSLENKKRFFSSWMNTIIESYIFIRLRRKRHSIEKKQDYLTKLHNDFMACKLLHSDKYIYKEFFEAYNDFVRLDFKSLLDKSQNK
ncbi:glycosyltransferase family 2 protein [Escherichia coli]|nr:glycosyltransferase family 2 protein [Escherichia coli]